MEADAGLGLTKETAEFQADAYVIGDFAVFVHGKARIINGVANREFLGIFGVAFVQRDGGLTAINDFRQMLDIFWIVALATQKGTLLKWQDGIGGREDIRCNRNVCHIGVRGQFIEGQGRKRSPPAHVHGICSPSKTHNAARHAGWRRNELRRSPCQPWDGSLA